MAVQPLMTAEANAGDVVARVLHEAGYQAEDNPAPGPHEPPVPAERRAQCEIMVRGALRGE